MEMSSFRLKWGKGEGLFVTVTMETGGEVVEVNINPNGEEGKAFSISYH